MVGAINFGLGFFRIDHKNVWNQGMILLKMELQLFLNIYEVISSRSKTQIHVYHPRKLPAEVLRP